MLNASLNRVIHKEVIQLTFSVINFDLNGLSNEVGDLMQVFDRDLLAVLLAAPEGHWPSLGWPAVDLLEDAPKKPSA